MGVPNLTFPTTSLIPYTYPPHLAPFFPPTTPPPSTHLNDIGMRDGCLCRQLQGIASALLLGVAVSTLCHLEGRRERVSS